MADYFEEMAAEAVRLAERAGLPGIEIAELREQILGGRRRADLTSWREHIRTTDTGLALRLIGRRVDVHPRDAFAILHSSEESADLGEFLNTEWHGHEILGRAALDDGAVIVLDLRPSMRRLTKADDKLREPTDPALPDDWQPGR